MIGRPFYETVYHRKDWVIADALRPQPGWGRRRFTTPAAALEKLSEGEIIAGAKEAAPEGYRLTSLSIYPDGEDERVIWSTPPDPRFGRRNAIDPARAAIQPKGEPG